MKKIIPVLLALLLMVGLMPVSAFAAEKKSDTIRFEEVYTKQSEKGLFTLDAHYYATNGWLGGTDQNYITITAADGLLITDVEAKLVKFSEYYDQVGISSGAKRKDEVWENGCYVTVKDIDATTFSFSDGSDWAIFQNITVYYTEHTHRYNPGYVCECGKIAPAGYTGSVLSGGNLTIIVGVAAAVVFGSGGFVLGRKKRSAPANSGNNEDND